jgi:hypothetical protein
MIVIERHKNLLEHKSQMSLNSGFRNSTTAVVDGNNSLTHRMTLHSVGEGEGKGERKGEMCSAVI